MERYKKRFKEENEKPDWFDKDITNILKVLRDESFGSEDQRKFFIDMLTTLHNSKDKRARKVFKVLGDYLTDIGDELIKYGQSVNENSRKFKEGTLYVSEELLSLYNESKNIFIFSRGLQESMSKFLTQDEIILILKTIKNNI